MSKLTGILKTFSKLRSQLNTLSSENKAELSTIAERTKVLTSENEQIKEILESSFMKATDLDK